MVQSCSLPLKKEPCVQVWHSSFFIFWEFPNNGYLSILQIFAGEEKLEIVSSSNQAIFWTLLLEMRKKGEEKVWKNLLNGLLRPYFLREKKDEGYLRYFTEGRKGIPQRLGFDLWTKVSHKDVVMFWKARNKKVKILDCLDSKHSSW